MDPGDERRVGSRTMELLDAVAVRKNREALAPKAEEIRNKLVSALDNDNLSGLDELVRKQAFLFSIYLPECGRHARSDKDNWYLAQRYFSFLAFDGAWTNEYCACDSLSVSRIQVGYALTLADVAEFLAYFSFLVRENGVTFSSEADEKQDFCDAWGRIQSACTKCKAEKQDCRTVLAQRFVKAWGGVHSNEHPIVSHILGLRLKHVPDVEHAAVTGYVTDFYGWLLADHPKVNLAGRVLKAMERNLPRAGAFELTTRCCLMGVRAQQ